jgi:hypothetical protein
LVACPECRSGVYSLTCVSQPLSSEEEAAAAPFPSRLLATITRPEDGAEVTFTVRCDMEISDDANENGLVARAPCGTNLPPWVGTALQVFAQSISAAMSLLIICRTVSDTLSALMLLVDMVVVALSLVSLADPLDVLNPPTASRLMVLLTGINLVLRIVCVVVDMMRRSTRDMYFVLVIFLLIHLLRCTFVAWTFVRALYVRCRVQTQRRLTHIQASFEILRGHWRGGICRLLYPVRHLGIDVLLAPPPVIQV